MISEVGQFTVCWFVVVLPLMEIGGADATMWRFKPIPNLSECFAAQDL